MCLRINNALVSLPESNREDGLLKGFKIICENNTPDCYKARSFFGWGFCVKKYHTGWNKSNRYFRKMSYQEERENCIYSGIHVYAKLPQAELPQGITGEKKIAVFFQPKDVIGIGYTYDGAGPPGFVVMKILIENLDNVSSYENSNRKLDNVRNELCAYK